MSDTFIRLTDDQGDPYYVKTTAIASFGASGNGDHPTFLRVDGLQT